MALLKEAFGDENMGIAAVSFAAAALWLFLDLDTSDFRDAKPYRLAELIKALADIARSTHRTPSAVCSPCSDGSYVGAPQSQGLVLWLRLDPDDCGRKGRILEVAGSA